MAHDKINVHAIEINDSTTPVMVTFDGIADNTFFKRSGSTIVGASVISEIEGEATLQFQQPTVISTKSGAGTITLESVGNSVIIQAGIDVRIKDDVLFFDNKKFWIGTSKDYWFEYNTSGSRYLFKSRDIDGIQTEGVIFRILDGTQNVQFLGEIHVDTVNEFIAEVGVTIDGVPIKDGLVDGVDVSVLNLDAIKGSGSTGILRKIQLQVADGATPGTNIDITRFTTQGRQYNGPSITDADDLAKSGTSGSYSLSANGENLTLDISETVTHVLSINVLSDDLNNGGGGGYYVHTLVIDGNIQLMVEKSGSITNLDWTDVTNTGSDMIIFDIAFLTSD